MRGIFSLIAVCLLTGCASLPFFPNKQLAATPDRMLLAWSDVFIPTDDGETLHGWFIPSRVPGPGQGMTLLFFHGNAGNISHRLDSVRIFNQLGLAVLIIDYRGYGRSTGTPTVPGVRKDAEAAWQWLIAKKGVPADSIIVFGRSLGGAVAATLLERYTPKAFIFESSFTSLYDVGKSMYPYLPVSWFLPHDFATIASMKGKDIPLLVVHSKDDSVVSYALGEKVYEAYQGPKQFLIISGEHNTGFLESSQIYIPGLAQFLDGLLRNAKK